MVFDNVGKECVLHASIGLRHQGEAIRANFGQEPFHYDIEDHVHQQRNLTWTKIQKTQLDSDVLQRLNQDDTSSASHDYSIASMTNGDPSTSHLTETLADETDELGDKNKTAVDQLVLSYLTHHGYSKTASALKGQCEASSSSKPPISRHPKPYSDDVDLRTTIVKAVACGDIDSALEGTAVNYPMVLEKELGLMLFKLRCRKFVELLLETAEALKRVKEEEADLENNVSAAPRGHNSFEGDIGLDGMDIDEDAFRPTHTNGFSQPGEDGMLTRRGRRRPSAASTESAQSALDDALSYGQRLEMDYKADVRPEVRAHLKRTFSVVAYEDPLAVGGDIAEIAGQQARDSLATELNQAILGTSDGLAIYSKLTDSIQNLKESLPDLHWRFSIVRPRYAWRSWACWAWALLYLLIARRSFSMCELYSVLLGFLTVVVLRLGCFGLCIPYGLLGEM